MLDLSSIWNGDVTRVRVARNAYRKNPGLETFIALVSALYSFRFLFWYAKELRTLLSSVPHPFYYQLVGAKPTIANEQIRLADRCDVLCTVYEWKFRNTGDELCLIDAEELYRKGVRFAAKFLNDPAHAHTYCLLELRYARILIAGERRDEAGAVLDRVIQAISTVSAISDPNQRSRIYTQLGLLLPEVADGDRHCQELAALYAGMATSFPGVGRMTRMKSRLAAWGIDL